MTIQGFKLGFDEAGLTGLAAQIKETPADHVNEANGKAIAAAAATFHRKAGTLNPAVGLGIDDIRSGRPIVRFAHQPNLLPYPNFTLMPFLVARLKQILDQTGFTAVPCFFIVDYDEASDERFRSSDLPPILPDSQAVRLSISGLKRSQVPAYLAPSYERSDIDRWRATSHEWIRKVSQLNRSWLRQDTAASHAEVDNLVDIYAETLDQGASASEANSLALSRIFNDLYKSPVVFIPLSNMLSYTRPSILHLAMEAGARDGSEWSAHIWITCGACRRRIPVKVSGMRVMATCKACGDEFDEPEPDFIARANSEVRQVLPRVIIDDALDFYALNVVGGIGYMSSLEHSVKARRTIGRDLIPWGPELLTRITLDDVLARAPTGREAVSTGRASLVYHVADVGLMPHLRGLQIESESV